MSWRLAFLAVGVAGIVAVVVALIALARTPLWPEAPDRRADDPD